MLRQCTDAVKGPAACFDHCSEIWQQCVRLLCWFMGIMGKCQAVNLTHLKKEAADLKLAVRVNTASGCSAPAVETAALCFTFRIENS